MALHLTKLESPSPKDSLCLGWFEFALWFWRKFLNATTIFSLFRLYFSRKKGAWYLIWTTVIFLYSGMLCANFGWNWPSRSGESRIPIPVWYMAISPFKKGVALLFVDRLWFSILKDALYQDWLKLDHWFWRLYLKVVYFY